MTFTDRFFDQGGKSHGEFSIEGFLFLGKTAVDVFDPGGVVGVFMTGTGGDTVDDVAIQSSVVRLEREGKRGKEN
jgi:hypothetical protein